MRRDWTAQRHRRWIHHRRVVVAVVGIAAAALAWVLVVVVPNYCRAEWVERRLPIDSLADKSRVRVPIRFQC